jgi:hypothetical protein
MNCLPAVWVKFSPCGRSGMFPSIHIRQNFPAVRFFIKTAVRANMYIRPEDFNDFYMKVLRSFILAALRSF